MNILEAIELRLYRYAQDGYRDADYVQKAKDMALEILNLTTENINNLRKENGG